MYRCLSQVIITLFLKEISQCLAETRVYATMETYLLLCLIQEPPQSLHSLALIPILVIQGHSQLQMIYHLGLTVGLYQMLRMPTSHRINKHNKLTHHHSHKKLVSLFTKNFNLIKLSMMPPFYWPLKLGSEPAIK